MSRASTDAPEGVSTETADAWRKVVPGARFMEVLVQHTGSLGMMMNTTAEGYHQVTGYVEVRLPPRPFFQ